MGLQAVRRRSEMAPNQAFPSCNERVACRNRPGAYADGGHLVPLLMRFDMPEGNKGDSPLGHEACTSSFAGIDTLGGKSSYMKENRLWIPIAGERIERAETISGEPPLAPWI
jgi:hypothetical protein